MKDRLTKEISYWDHRAAQLELEENAGKTGARLNSGEARRRADTMQTRLQKRLADLKRDAQISPRPPVVLGGLLVVPRGLLDAMTGRPAPTAPVDTQASAARARAIVMATEHRLGFEPTDRELDKLGYDIESRVPATGGAPVPRGQGAQERRRDHHGHAQRDPLLACSSRTNRRRFR